MVIVVDLANQPDFFVRAIVSLDISRVVGLAISGAISIETDIVDGFFELFL